jgi:hypothetical protein
VILAPLFFLLAISLTRLVPRQTRPFFLAAVLIRTGVSIVATGSEWSLLGVTVLDDQVFYEAALRLADSWEIDFFDLGEWLRSGGRLFILIHAALQELAFGPSIVTSYFFSLLVGSAATALLCQVWKLLWKDESKIGKYLPLIYSISPNVLIFQSLIVREGLQSLGFLYLTLLAALSWRSGWTLQRSAKFTFTIFALMFLHHSFFLLAGLASASLLVGSLGGLRRLRRRGGLLVPILMFLTISSTLLVISDDTRYFGSLSVGTIDLELDDFLSQKHGMSRATYSSGGVSLAAPGSVISAFLKYQMLPLPFQGGTPGDYILAAANCFRASLLAIYVARRRRLKGTVRPFLDAVAVSWGIVELGWAIGTQNWGTAARHHVPAYGMLLLLAAAGLSASARKTVRKKLTLKRPSQADRSL